MSENNDYIGQHRLKKDDGDDTQQFASIGGDHRILPEPKPVNEDEPIHVEEPIDGPSRGSKIALCIGLAVFLVGIWTVALVDSQKDTVNTTSSDKRYSSNIPIETPSASPEPTQAPSSKAPEAPVTVEPSTEAPVETVNPTPTANFCDITLLKSTMTQGEAEEYVAKCPVAGKKAAQVLVNWFENHTNVYSSTPKTSSDLRELKRELGPANYGHMRAGMDVFQYLYHNHAEIQNTLTIASANNKELAIDQQFLELWYKSSAWNAYSTDEKQPMFNALALRHYLALRAA